MSSDAKDIVPPPTDASTNKLIDSSTPKQNQATNNADNIDYDEIEKDLGISQYMSPLTKGFSAVVKGRFSDFVVHEVALDGTIARLTSRDIDIKSESKDANSTKEENLTSNSEQVASAEATKTPDNDDTSPSSTDQWPTLQSQLGTLIKDTSIAEKVIKLLQAHNENVPCDDKFVTLPALEKAQRKAVHDWVRESLCNSARADTLDGKIRIWHLKFEKEMPNYQKFFDQRGGGDRNNKRGNDSRGNDNRNKRSKNSWPEDRPDFLQFVLYKENIDTTTATKELSRKGSKARIGYAGMKDKRGITTQFCTLYRTEPQQIVGERFASGGGGSTKQKGFSVVQVGNFEYVAKEMRLGTLKGNRFDIVLRNVQTGTGDKDDATSGRETLEVAANAMKQYGFINYFGTQRFGKYQDTHLIGIAVLHGDFRKAIDTLMSPKPDDRPDAAKGRKDWESRFDKLPTDGSNDPKTRNELERESAKRVIRTLNRFMTAETSVMQSLSRFPQDYKRAFTCIPKTLRMMFLHAVQSLIWNRAASHRIEMSRTDVLPGDLVLVEHESVNSSSDKQPNTAPVPHVVTEEDVASKKYSIEDVVLPLIGTKSKLPTNKSGDMLKKLLSEVGVSMDMFKKIQDRELALNGDYRKLMCRPSDFEYEIKEYYDERQPLLQTDLMKLNGEEITISSPPEDENQPKKIAMIVGLTLPASAYATVALRELMKKPTSSEYQKDLKL